jgi:hypothetical protein
MSLLSLSATKPAIALQMSLFPEKSNLYIPNSAYLKYLYNQIVSERHHGPSKRVDCSNSASANQCAFSLFPSTRWNSSTLPLYIFQKYAGGLHVICGCAVPKSSLLYIPKQLGFLYMLRGCSVPLPKPEWHCIMSLCTTKTHIYIRIASVYTSKSGT